MSLVRGFLIDPRQVAFVAGAVRERLVRYRRDGVDVTRFEPLAADLEHAALVIAGNASGIASQTLVAGPETLAPSGLKRVKGSATPSAVAQHLGVSPVRVRQLLAAGLLAGEKRGGRWWTSWGAVYEYQEARRAS